MFVKNIGLQHYRNYGLLRLESLGDVNLILGQNAQAKQTSWRLCSSWR